MSETKCSMDPGAIVTRNRDGCAPAGGVHGVDVAGVDAGAVLEETTEGEEVIGFGYERKTVEVGHTLPSNCPLGEFYRAAESVRNQAQEAGIDVSSDTAVWVRSDDENIEIYFTVTKETNA